MNITIRNIPDSIFEKIKMMSEIDRRSLNSEMLIAIEKGAVELEKRLPESGHAVSKEVRLAIWNDVCGKWKDSKSKEQTVKEIYASRSMGREFSL